MDNYKTRRRFIWDEKGALEGLPLYLIILVVIAAIAIVVIISFINQTPDLKSFEVTLSPNEDAVHTSDPGTLTVKCWDTTDSPLKGVTVKILGAGITPQVGKTDSKGEWTSDTLDPDFQGTFSSITVTMEYTGQVSVKKETQVSVIND